MPTSYEVGCRCGAWFKIVNAGINRDGGSGLVFGVAMDHIETCKRPPATPPVIEPVPRQIYGNLVGRDLDPAPAAARAGEKHPDDARHQEQLGQEWIPIGQGMP